MYARRYIPMTIWICTFSALLGCAGCTGEALTLTDAAFADLIRSATGADDSGRIDDNPSADDPNEAEDPNNASDDPNSAVDDGGVQDDSSLYTDGSRQANLQGVGDASGSAEYLVVDGRRKFKIEVQHVAPGDYTVRINGIEIFTLSVDATGFAEVEFDSKSEAGHAPFPEDFPESIENDDTVDIGGIVSGTFTTAQ